MVNQTGDLLDALTSITDSPLVWQPLLQNAPEAREAKTHPAGGGFFNTQYFADPKEQVLGIIMKQTQGHPTHQTERKFRLLIGQAIDY